MSDRNKSNATTQMVLGLFVIAVGMLFLLDNLGWVDLDFRLHLWPTALMFVGVLKILQTRTQSGMIVGGAFIFIGGMVLLKETGLLHISWHSLWPVLLIAAGLAVVFKSTTGSSIFAHSRDFLNKEVDDSVVNITAIMGGFKRRVTTADFRGGEITSIMGGCDLDLRQSSINGDALLNVFAMFGGITLRVPIDWTVELEGTPIMGGFEEKTVPPASAGKRLIVRGYVIMGGLEVRN
jgi:predicted membrane protein